MDKKTEYEVISFNANELYLTSDEDRERANRFIEIMTNHNKNSPDIILSQEIVINDEKSSEVLEKIGKNWKVLTTNDYCKKEDQNNAIFYNSEIFEGNEIDNKNLNERFSNFNSNFLAVKLTRKKTNFSIICVSVHISPNHKTDLNNFKNFISYLKNEYRDSLFIIGGDFNYGSKKLKSLFCELGLCVDCGKVELQTICPSDSTIDHFIVSKNLDITFFDYAIEFKSDNSAQYVEISNKRFYWCENAYSKEISDHAPIKIKFKLEG